MITSLQALCLHFVKTNRMGQISLRKIQFAAFLYDASPQATKAREKAGVRKLVMLVSDRLAQTHSVDKFRTFEQNDMCELIADALFSQEEFPPESLEFCELISIVSELEKGFRGKYHLLRSCKFATLLQHVDNV